MAKGDSKVSNHDDDSISSDNETSDSDSDSEFTPPTFEELTKLLKKYTKIIMKSNEKLDKLKLEKKDLVNKSNEHEANGTKCKIELDNLKVNHSELDSRYSLLKKEFQDLKASYKNLELTFGAMSNDKYDSIKVVKVDCSTSCDDLVNPPMKPFKCDLCNGNGGIVESCNDELALENEFLKSENDKLKQQVVELKSGYKTLSNGYRLHVSVVTRAINYAKNGLGFPFPKLVEANKNRPERPKIKYCTECRQDGHFSFECKTPPAPKLWQNRPN
jgi:hypothetical protein